MYCTKKVTDDLIWVGANDRRLAMFEGVYSVPKGVSYNSYLLLDKKTVLFDTVDKAVSHRFLENLVKALDGRSLDYLVVQHIEPDHSAVLLDLLSRYPNMKLVCNAQTLIFIKQFYNFQSDSRVQIVKEGDTLNTGKHNLSFVFAPMVHWPEVMVTYDSTDKILFSADAFGCFGALNGSLFADEVDFNKDYMDEARRYYANIVGKYGNQTAALLKKAGVLQINMICPLHGFVWREKLQNIISKYQLWSRYEPEELGVVIAYASVYGNTENAAEILACMLREKGIKTTMFDVSVTPASEIIAAAFKWSHLVFASTTYNAGVFVTMEALISDLVAHNIQNRTVGLIENGTWATTSGNLMREKLEFTGPKGKLSKITFIENMISIESSVKESQLADIESMANALAASFPAGMLPATSSLDKNTSDAKNIDAKAMFKLSYGLFVLSAKDGSKDNGCIINTVTQITEKPMRISIAVNKLNYTHDMIVKTKEFNVSVLTESAPFRVFEHFGFKSGKDTNKFADCSEVARTANGICYVPKFTNGVISGKVCDIYDYGTHSVFVADVTQAIVLSDEPSTTYQYYSVNIKPKPQIPTEIKKGFICKTCGYIYEGDTLPKDYVCPLCKHGYEDFEAIK